MNGQQFSLSHLFIAVAAIVVPLFVAVYDSQPRPYFVATRDDDDIGHQVVTLANASPKVSVVITRLSFIVTDKDDLEWMKEREAEWKHRKRVGSPVEFDSGLFTSGFWRKEDYQFDCYLRTDVEPGKAADIRVGIVNEQWGPRSLTGTLYVHYNGENLLRVYDYKLWPQDAKSIADETASTLISSTLKRLDVVANSLAPSFPNLNDFSTP